MLWFLPFHEIENELSLSLSRSPRATTVWHFNVVNALRFTTLRSYLFFATQRFSLIRGHIVYELHLAMSTINHGENLWFRHFK